MSFRRSIASGGHATRKDNSQQLSAIDERFRAKGRMLPDGMASFK